MFSHFPTKVIMYPSLAAIRDTPRLIEFELYIQSSCNRNFVPNYLQNRDNLGNWY